MALRSLAPAWIATSGVFATILMMKEGGPPPGADLNQGLPLLGAYLLAELTAPRLPALGRFPLSACAWIALTKASLGFALLTLALGTLLRFLRLQRRGHLGQVLPAEAIPEIFSALVAHLTAAFNWAPVAVGLTYFGLWRMLPEVVFCALPEVELASWSFARERSKNLVAFVVTQGSLLLFLDPVSAGLVAGLAGSLVLLAVPLHGYLKVTGVELEVRQRALLERDRRVALGNLEVVQSQVDQQQAELQMQRGLLEIVGDLFLETAHMENPAGIRPVILKFVSRILSAQRICLYEINLGNYIQTAALGGNEQHDPDPALLALLSRDKLRATRVSQGWTYIGVVIPNRGLLLACDPDPGWTQQQQTSFGMLGRYLPLVLDSLRFQELQAHALAYEKWRSQELDRWGQRLTLALDILGQLVSRGSLEELVAEAQRRLPELVDGIDLQIHWAGTNYPSLLPSPLPAGELEIPLVGTRGAEGTAILRKPADRVMENLDLQLTKMFCSQLSHLLEGIQRKVELQNALDQLKRSQAQLLQSSKMAAIGQLAAGIAHELNTPLAAVSVGVELALDILERSPVQAGERLEIALGSATQMQEIISKLLTYSREQDGQRERVDLRDIVTNSLKLVSHSLEMENIELQLRTTQSLRLVASATEIQQVLCNLLINARDACKHPQASQKRIEVWYESIHDQACVHVRDYGCGMDAQIQAHLFEPFFTTKPIGEGTGLGLSTSLQLVRGHGGTLRCQSSPGQGTHFLFTVPIQGLKGQRYGEV